MAEARRGLLSAAAATVFAATAACGGGGGGGGGGVDRPTAPAGTTALATPASGAPSAALPDKGLAGGTYAPAIDPAAFSGTVTNPFFPLRPGMSWVYRSATPDGVETTTVTVTDRTRTVMGVPCVEVRDTVRLDGEVTEDTLDWYAQHRDGSVWYFGEDTKEYENGKVSTTHGSWEAGVAGALPGVVMPARPGVGDSYRQEYSKGEAEDMADVRSVSAAAEVPAGTYRDVVRTRDYTPLDPKLLEHKYYARGVGVVLVEDVAAGDARDELVRFSP